MISAKQLAANRANAQFSTGPITPEGKAITRLNAVQHALTGQLTIVDPPDHAAFTALSDRLTADLKPAGEQELQIATRIVRDTWRLHRTAAHEDNIYALGMLEQLNKEVLDGDAEPAPDPTRAAVTNARTFFNKLREFNLAGLYQQRIHRSLMKDYALFRQLQLERKRLEEIDRKREETKLAAAPRPAVALKAAAASGSDFSGIFEAPQGRSSDPKIASDLINSAPPTPPPPAKTSPEAQKAA
jgi:hypothetical protein